MRGLGALEVVGQLAALFRDFLLGTALLRLGLHGLLLLRRDDADVVHERRDLIHDRAFHFLEHVQRFDLVLGERVALAVRAQVDAVAQHVHVVEVLHPLRVDDAEHDDFFELAHVLFAEQQLSLLIAFERRLFERFLQAVAAHGRELFFFQLALRRVDFFRVLDEAVERPFLRVQLFVRVLVHLRLDDVVDHREDVVLEVLARQDLAALAVHDFALLVHDVVVFEDVLADVEVARLDLLLRVLDGVRDELVLDGLVLFHAELIHDLRHAVGREQAQEIILEREIEARCARVALAAGAAAELVVDAAGLVAFRADDEEAAERLDAFAELDIRAAAGHVRRDRDRAHLAGIGDNLRFAFMVLRIQHVVLDAEVVEDGAELFRLRDGRRADEHRLPFLVDFLHGVADGLVLRAFRLVDDVRIVDALHRLVRRDDDDGEVVNLEELVLLRLRRARHARELVVHAEIVLERDGRERLALALDFHALFRLNGLMQAVAETAAGHDAARELVDDDDFAVFHDIVAVALHERFRAQRRREAMRVFDVLRGIKVLDADELLDFRHGAVGRRNRLLLLVDLVVRALFQRRDRVRHFYIDIRRFLAGAGNDERRTRLVDEDRVDLVDDGVMERPLHHLALLDDHVVAQIIEAELVVRAERDIAAVRELALGEVHVVHDEADREAEEAVEASHPLRVALREVIVDRDHVHALALERVEVDGQRRDERLAFAGAHLGDAAVVQAHAANELHVEMAHAEHAARALAHDSERLRQDVIERLAVLQPLTELVRLARQLVVRQALHLRFERIDFFHDLLVGRDVLVVVVTQESFQKTEQIDPLLKGIYAMKNFICTFVAKSTD